MVALGVSIAAMIGSGMVARSIPYEKGIGKKQLAWALHVSTKCISTMFNGLFVTLKIFCRGGGSTSGLLRFYHLF